MNINHADRVSLIYHGGYLQAAEVIRGRHKYYYPIDYLPKYVLEWISRHTLAAVEYDDITGVRIMKKIYE